MTHTILTPLASWVGLFAGSLSVCFAVYLWFVSDRVVKFRYIAAFFAAGAYITFTNTAPLTTHAIESSLRLAVVSITLGLEIYAFRWVIEHSPKRESPDARRTVAD